VVLRVTVTIAAETNSTAKERLKSLVNNDFIPVDYVY
jgi:hypothetical protein